MKKIFKSLNIDSAIFFLGTDAEIADAEEREERAIKEVEKIINLPKFIGMEYTTGTSKRILTRSIRNGIKWQLSYFLGDTPVMHENYIQTGEIEEKTYTGKELYQHFVNQFLDSDLELEILTA